jgi:hypothetical protein
MRMRTVPARRVRRLVEPLGADLVASVPQPRPGMPWLMAAHYLRVGSKGVRPGGTPADATRTG